MGYGREWVAKTPNLNILLIALMPTRYQYLLLGWPVAAG